MNHKGDIRFTVFEVSMKCVLPKLVVYLLNVCCHVVFDIGMTPPGPVSSQNEEISFESSEGLGATPCMDTPALPLGHGKGTSKQTVDQKTSSH